MQNPPEFSNLNDNENVAAPPEVQLEQQKPDQIPAKKLLEEDFPQNDEAKNSKTRKYIVFSLIGIVFVILTIVILSQFISTSAKDSKIVNLSVQNLVIAHYDCDPESTTNYKDGPEGQNRPILDKFEDADFQRIKQDQGGEITPYFSFATYTAQKRSLLENGQIWFVNDELNAKIYSQKLVDWAKKCSQGTKFQAQYNTQLEKAEQNYLYATDEKYKSPKPSGFRGFTKNNIHIDNDPSMIPPPNYGCDKEACSKRQILGLKQDGMTYECPESLLYVDIVEQTLLKQWHSKIPPLVAQDFKDFIISEMRPGFDFDQVLSDRNRQYQNFHDLYNKILQCGTKDAYSMYKITEQVDENFQVMDLNKEITSKVYHEPELQKLYREKVLQGNSKWFSKPVSWLKPYKGHKIVVSPKGATEKQEYEKKIFQEYVNKHKVVLFTKSYCPFSAASKTLLNHNGVEFLHFDMDIIEDGQDLYNALKFYTRYMTVPNIFIGGIEIGGSDTLQQMAENGELKKMLDNIEAENKFER